MSPGNFFQYLIYLFKGDNDSIYKIRELNLIYKTFTSSRYKYVTKDRHITQQFLNKIFNLLKSVLICYDFFDSTLFSNDDTRKRVFTRFYIESFLPEQDLDLKDKFSKEFIIKRLQESDNPNKTIQSIEQEFNDFKAKFNNAEFAAVEIEYNFFLSLRHLCLFNFEGFISKFDPSFSLKLMKSPTHVSVSGTEVLAELKDFYYIIASMPRKLHVLESVRKLSTREKGPDAPAFAKKVQQAVDDIYKMLQNDFQPEIILNLIRYVEQNPKAKIRIFQENIKIIDDYKKELIETFAKTKKIVIQQFSENALQKSINDLFQGKSLLPIEGWTDELVESLVSKSLDVKGVQGLKIAKTFVIDQFESKSKDLVNTFILEGFFADKDFQKQFAESLFKAGELKKILLEKEHELGKGQSNSFATLILSVKGSGAANQRKTEMTIKVIEERIRTINQRVVEDMYQLGKNLFSALSDYKNPKPELITNIRDLKAGGNKEFISSIILFYGAITKFIKIMKNFSTTTKD